MLTLTSRQVVEMVAHARQEAPNECCGLLFGREGRVERVFRGTNVDRSPLTYRMDPRELLEIPRMEAQGLNLVGIYHSHPASPAVPSRTDVARAYYPDVAYVIVSLAAAEPDVRAYRIADGRVEDVELVIR
ncbi:MAG: M67 family metallopeptidase [Armatimonadota bacterium]|nr:M67 family metallopeptidase [Armatimonadota bacterium]